MRHKYATKAIVLARHPLAESALLVTLLTEEFGVVRARAEGLRKPGAKLAHALQTLDACEVTLVRGKEGWRLSGALLEEHWFRALSAPARARAGRIVGLVLRLVHGEANDTALYPLLHDFLMALPMLSGDEQDTAEVYAALRLLNLLGLDAGPLPAIGDYAPLSPEARRAYVTRVNQGIMASGL